jgi:RES domain-containing protein
VLTDVWGTFVKIAFPQDVGLSLSQGLPNRPAARFNRVGQDALYLSPDELSARVAIGEYVKPDDPPRVLLTYEVSHCALFDLRQPSAADVYELARQP